MTASFQWQPVAGDGPEGPMYFQSQPFYLQNSNLEPLYGDFNNMQTSDFVPLYGNFKTMPSSGISGDSFEGYPSEMISNRIEVVADDLPVTDMIPVSTADMLPVSQKVPISEDWDLYRSTIIRLYRDEDRKLEDVMQIMRTQHHFHATVKMYKSRLAAWDVRKYMTRAEREVACRVLKLNQRTGEAAGKIIVRGKERNPDVFLRHMGQSRAAIRRRQLLQSSDRLKDIVIDSVNTKQFQSLIWPTMYPPGPQRNVEIICRETLSLVLTSKVCRLVHRNDIHNFLCAARDRFNTKRFADVRILLNRAATWFFDTVCTQPANAVLGLLNTLEIEGLDENYASDFLACFHHHLLNLVRERYGPQHSLTKLLMQIFQIKNNFVTKQQVYRSTWTAIISNLKLGGKADLSRFLLEAVKSFDGQTYRKDDAWVECNFNLASHYIMYKPDMHEEAERMLNVILEAGRMRETGKLDPYHAHHAYWGLGILAAERDQEDTAIKLYHLVVQAAFEEWGADSSKRLGTVTDLAQYLRYLGREEEAVEVERLINLTDELSEVEFG